MDDNDFSHSLAEGETSFKKRPRKKHLYRQILEQMEFYFSDANLNRDRFLSQLLAESQNVPLEIFLSFNKIRSMTGSAEEIAKALGSSELLKVTEDGKCVYRTLPIKKKENVDDCMIYVEQLPADANHDWLIGIFSAYGKVDYVSIPKYKNRSVNKGFAFVEFDTPEAAKKALEAFGSAGCCLPPQMAPEDLCSVATLDEFVGGNAHKDTVINIEYSTPEKEKKKLRKDKVKFHEEVGETFIDSEKAHGSEQEESDEPKAKKLKTNDDREKKKKKDKADNEYTDQRIGEECSSESEVIDSFKTKKIGKRKLENDDTANLNDAQMCDDVFDDNSEVKKKKKKKRVTEEETVANEEEDFKIDAETSEVQSAIKSKKKKKHQLVETDGVTNDNEAEEEDTIESHKSQEKKKKKKKHRETESEDGDREDEADDEGTTKNAKRQKKGEDDNDENEEGVEDNEENLEKSDKKKKRKRSKKKKSTDKKENDPVSLGLRIISKKEWTRLRNKYLNLQRDKMRSLKKHLARVKYGSSYQSPYPAKESGPREGKDQKPKSEQKIKFVPGTIIHIELDEPLGDVRAFKFHAQSHPGVVYVDANEGDTEVHVRCSTGDVAQGLASEKVWDNLNILEGEAEKTYWEKIQEYRKNKIGNNVVTRHLSGRKKLLKRAERELGKHIKFDD